MKKRSIIAASLLLAGQLVLSACAENETSSEGLYTDQAYATAVVLLIAVIAINWLSGLLAKKITKG